MVGGAMRRNAVMGAADVMYVSRVGDVQARAGWVGMVLGTRGEGRLTESREGDANGEHSG